MKPITKAKTLSTVRKQLLENLLPDWKQQKESDGEPSLEIKEGVFVRRLYITSSPGYGQGRVLKPFYFIGIQDFRELTGCIPYMLEERGGFFRAPFVLRVNQEGQFGFPHWLPYQNEDHLEANKPGLLEHFRTALASFPAMKSYEDLDAILGPIRSDSLPELMEEWIDRPDSPSPGKYEAVIKGYPNITLNVWYGPYAFGLWKLVLAKFLDRDYLATKNWFQGILDQSGPKNFVVDPTDPRWGDVRYAHQHNYLNIVAAFEKITAP